MKKILMILIAVILSFTVQVFATDDVGNGLDTVSEDEYDNDVGNGLRTVPEDEYIDDVKNGLDTDSEDEYSDEIESDYATIAAEIIKASDPYIEFDESFGCETTYQDIEVKITDKERFTGEIYPIKYCLSYYLTNDMVADRVNVGDDVYIYVIIEDGKIAGDPYLQYVDKQNILVWIIVIYALAIILIGGKKGVKALVSLILTVLAIFYILIPMIYDGKDPIMVTIFTCIAVTLVTFIIVSGFSKKTTAAIVGTSCGIIVAGIFAVVFGNLMKLSGVGENSLMLTTAENIGTFDFKGLMFAGMMIGALGAAMDVGMSIASSIAELKEKNPALTTKELIKSGMNIGKDIMGTMTNTLILAYTGGAITTILIFMAFKWELYQILNQEMIAEEILKAIAGSLGIVFTIPLTTLASAFLMGKKNMEGKNER